MKQEQQNLLIATSLAALLLCACASRPEGVYRGGVLIQPGPLALSEQYSINLLDKWRLSHSWIGGPVDIRYCKHSPVNGTTVEERYLEVDGVLTAYLVSESPNPKHRGKVFASVPWESVYGLDPTTREFQGRYSSLCHHTFREIWSGMSVYLIKPDPAKGTDDWISGAKPVTINGLRWLHKEIPPADYSKNREQSSAPIEHWILQIPDSPYWFAMRLIGSTGGNGDSWGINRDPAKFEEVRTIFHQMVASVRLTPLPPPEPP